MDAIVSVDHGPSILLPSAEEYLDRLDAYAPLYSR